jgi:glucose-1-phosphate adenylyltransferase
MPATPIRVPTGLPAQAKTLALVLAGGNGTRLGELTRWECKPALPFAGKFRNIDFSLSNCVHSGIRRIAVLTQYKSQTLIRHLEQAWSFLPRGLGEFVELWPAQQRVQPDWYSGTANAVYQNLDMIRAHAPELILVLAGDHIYKMDYRRLLREHVQSQVDVTIACVRMPRSEAAGYGVLTASAEGLATDFIEKPHPSELQTREDSILASMGVYVFNAEYLYERLARDAQVADSLHDFGRDVLPAAVIADKVGTFVFTDPETGQRGYWRDVGTLDSYWKAHMELLERNPPMKLFDEAWPIFTHARQLPPALLLAGTRPGVVVDSLISEGCVVRGATVFSSVLGPGAEIGADSVIEQSVVMPDARIGAGCHLRRVIVESGSRVPDGLVIGEDPAADAERFQLSAEGIVLASASALSRAELLGDERACGYATHRLQAVGGA